MPEELDQQLDETAARANAAIAASQELMNRAEREKAEFEAWKEEHGIRPELHDAVFSQLTDSQKALFEKEKERFEREAAHDLDAALAHLDDPSTRPPAPKRKRNYV
jgi:hypothetical protein